jgi:hypothetical protein
MTDAPHLLLKDLLLAPDDATFTRLLRDGVRGLMRKPVQIGPIAFTALADDGDHARAAARLLATALDEARTATENDQPEGPALLAALADAVIAQDGRTPLSVPKRLALARAYASAGLEPPPFAILTADAIADHRPDAPEMPDLTALLDPVLREFAGVPGQAHAALSELLAGLPPGLAATLVSMTVSRPGALEARLGLYWLLDPHADIRLAAASALSSRLDLPSDLATLLPTLRKWMPDDPARSAVDDAIRRQLRKDRPPVPYTVKVHRATASLPDGVGAQSLVAAVQIGSRRVVALCMLKQGHGVKDAFVISCTSATEQKGLMAQVLGEIDTFDLPPAALAVILARGIGEGLSLARLPAPGMVDMAEIWGPDALSPLPAGTADILAALGPVPQGADEAALIASSAAWMDHFPHVDSWFEDTGDLRKALSRARTDAGREAAAWKHLATRRDFWARTIACGAAVLQAAQDPAWPSFAAVARALAADRPLKRIPILKDIVGMTLEAWGDAAAEDDADDAAAEDDADDAAELLAEAGLGDAFLDGYLTALAISPLAPAPELWLFTLIGGIEFPGNGSIDRVMAAIAARAGLIDEEAADPAAIVGHIQPLDADGLQSWCAGFHTLVTAAPRTWPARSLGPDDKRLLRVIGKVAEGNTDSTLVTVLPAWIAQRHARRK